MIEQAPEATVDQQIFRLAVPRDDMKVIRHELRDTTDARAIEEARVFFADGPDALAAGLLDDPFRPKPCPSPFPSGRFSDGQWPVFYSAMAPETVIEEVRHWVSTRYPDGLAPHYRMLRCHLHGTVRDLVVMKAAWPWLIDEDWTRCQALAREARESLVDAFLAPSARHPAGITTPVFKRTALSAAVAQEWMRFHPDPTTGTIHCSVAETA